ncbi:MAG: nitroreductase family protein [Muribaculaceae bacterium]|nr:nitroreductase family protein [Muribaculaceae bacterium]
MTILEAIKLRRSVRNYNGEPLNHEMIEKMQDAIRNTTDPFGGDYVLKLVGSEAGEFRPSTYGVIKGARNYLLLGVGDASRDALSAGFATEQVILRATQFGLGTCWIAATFKNSDFEKEADFPSQTPLKIVSPIGIPSEKGSLLNSLTRTLVRSDKRKPLGKLFFNQNFETPMTEDGSFSKALEMLRLAPSSTNSQPWRALVRGNQVDFYITSDSMVHYINLGIGLCHFALACDAQNVTGAFITNNLPVEAPDGWRYVTTFVEA